MKKLFALLFIATLFSCSTSDDSNTESTTFAVNPEANVAHDTSNYGIYKGILVGPSGVAKININNDGTINAKLSINGSEHVFSTQESVIHNQNISGLTFSKGNMKFDFNCNAHGDEIQITDLIIPGYEKASMILMKEYSDVQVKCFQGTYTGQTDNGTFNIMTSGELVYGLAYSVPDDSVWYIQGSSKGTSMTGSMENANFSGGIFGNSANGVWQNFLNQNGSWNVNRTL
ncbi:hypothetical protein KIH23_00625 [Flavobacterium sp. CYK-55]|uniref:hypothetical protein n=1 Tax=Flavobacterium sp. CYK-55 TaxID=2835529 RepID=UPI001BCA6D69|nr:hypothetical protein [Flavobacterium sp. CYK-55]MBS7785786.1 hypothetical protein [Flavobacterium sp. CYK-55]